MGPVRKADNQNLGSLTSWKPLGNSRPVTGLLYIFFYINRSNAGVLSKSTALLSQGMEILSALRYTNLNITQFKYNGKSSEFSEKEKVCNWSEIGHCYYY
jgi:hypothetical protein